MPRAIWTGAISFGLVHIPVRLVTALHSTGIHFHQLHRQDGTRLQQRMVCPADNEEVSGEQIARGYEIATDEYVIVEDEELDNLAPESSRAMQISDFVDMAQIDALYYDRPYYLLPEEGGAAAYRLLVRAMTDSQQVGIAKFVMRQNEYLAALRPLDNVICLEIMRFAEAVTTPDQLEEKPVEGEIDQRQLQVAHQLIQALATDFDPTRYHDEYRERLEQLIRQKVEGEEIVVQPPVESKPTEVADLLSALEKSLQRAKEDRQEQPA